MSPFKIHLDISAAVTFLHCSGFAGPRLLRSKWPSFAFQKRLISVRYKMKSGKRDRNRKWRHRSIAVNVPPSHPQNCVLSWSWSTLVKTVSFKLIKSKQRIGYYLGLPFRKKRVNVPHIIIKVLCDLWGKKMYYLPVRKSSFLASSILNNPFPMLIKSQTTFSFLDASTHLYNRLCPSVGPSVGWSFGNHFFKNIESG